VTEAVGDIAASLLANTTATINGVPAPLVLVTPAVLQIPYETAPVAPSAPGIFTDATNNSMPVGSGSAGQVVTLTITGDGLVSPPLADGATSSPDTPMDQLLVPQLPVTVTIGKEPATVQFIGITSGNVGITRIDFVVPNDAAPGLQAVVMTVGGAASAAANFTVVQAVVQ